MKCEENHCKSKMNYKSIRLYKNGNSIDLNFDIQCESEVIIKAKYFLSPLEWNYNSTYEQIISNFPPFVGFGNIKGIIDFLIESLESKEFSLEEKKDEIIFAFEMKVFKRTFELHLLVQELKDLTSLILEMNKQILRLSQKIKPSFAGSDILYEDEVELINNWIDPKVNIKMKMLYKETRDGFSDSEFKQIWYKEPLTLLLVKSHLDFRFGLFLSASLKVNQINDDSFLFSLNYGKKYNQKIILENQNYNSNYFSSNYFVLHDRPAENFNSHSSRIDNDFIAGSYTFLVKEIELYQVEIGK